MSHRDVAAAIIIKDGKIFIGQRNLTQSYPLHWEFPGGKLEEGEGFVEALKRELQEELQIKAEIGPNIHTSLMEKDQYFVNIYLVTQYEGEINPHQYRATKWVYPADLANYRFPWADQEFVDKYLHRLPGMTQQ